MSVELGELDWTEVRALDDGQLGVVCTRCHNPAPLCTVDSGDTLAELVGVVDAHREECESRRKEIADYAASMAAQ